MMVSKIEGYRLLPRARADVADIWRFTAARWSLRQADDYIEKLTATFEQIAMTPLQGRERTEFHPPVRIRHHAAHLIVYRIEASRVVVIRVLHGRSDWNAIIGDA